MSTSTRPIRSRRGCKTCKIRKVKCGEERPICVRCASTGRKCEYGLVLSSTFSSAPATVSILERPPSQSPNIVWRERRAFAYYFQHAAVFVGGQLDSDFWGSVVPQLCRNEPAVWDAIISISALFESPEPCQDFAPLRQQNSRNLSQNHRDALGWYSRSVSAVRQRLERGDVDIFVGLVSCVLFICIEALQGGEEEALQLYTQGVHLILTLRAQISRGTLPAAKAALLEDTIVPIFIRLGVFALTISGVPVGSLLQETGYASALQFDSLKSARDAIITLAIEAQLFQRICQEHPVMSHGSCLPLDLFNEQRTMLARLQSWHTAFTNFMNSLRRKGTLSSVQISTSSLFLAYHEMLFIMIEICLCPLQMITDSYLPNFQNIVDQSSIALDSSTQSDGTQPPFTFGINVGFPLWFTILRCRDPSIRRSALALLRRSPQVQAFYKCATVAVVGERVMILEETYGMALNAARGPPNILASESTNVSSEYESSDQGNTFDFHTQPSIPTPADIERRNRTATLIPEEARLGPIGIYRPGDPLSPGTTESDVSKWNLGRDQIFLRFCRNQRHPATGDWRVVHEYSPLDI